MNADVQNATPDYSQCGIEGVSFLIEALFCKSCFGLFQLVSAYSLSQNTIESAETSRLFHQPNQPRGSILLEIDLSDDDL
jgi:hypothetical protein